MSIITKTIISGSAAVVLLGLIGMTFLLGDRYGVEHVTITQVTPHLLAEAMKGDHFYSDYRENTLLVTGRVGDLTQGSIGLVTDSTYSLDCAVNGAIPKVTVGSTVRFVAEAAGAVRDAHGVTLTNCMFL